MNITYEECYILRTTYAFRNSQEFLGIRISCSWIPKINIYWEFENTIWTSFLFGVLSLENKYKRGHQKKKVLQVLWYNSTMKTQRQKTGQISL